MTNNVYNILILCVCVRVCSLYFLIWVWVSPLLISFASTLCHLCTYSACWIVFLHLYPYCPYLGEFTYNLNLPSMSSSYLFWKLPPIISGASLSFDLTWRSCCMKHWKHDPTTATRQHGGTQNTSSPEPSPLCLTRNNYERRDTSDHRWVWTIVGRLELLWKMGVWLGWTLPILHTDAAQTDSEVIYIWLNAEIPVLYRNATTTGKQNTKASGGIGGEWMPAVG